MRLYKYLNEGFVDILTQEKAEELLRTKCKNNFTKMKSRETFLFRGDGNVKSDLGHIDSRKITRKSANADNHYTILFSGLLPAGKQAPPRNKALICSNDDDYASEYGHVSAIIPYDGTLLGICSDDDIGTSFKKGLSSLYDCLTPSAQKSIGPKNVFADALGMITDGMSSDLKIKDDESSLTAALNKPLSTWPDIFDPAHVRTGITLQTLLSMHLNPSTNGFKFTTDVGAIPMSNQSREVGFSGECIFVSDMYDAFIENFNV